MSNIIVVSSRKDWPIHLDNAEVVEAEEYLSDPRFLKDKKYRVYNLCRSYKYLSNGYYVSLLAGARGHRPIPSVTTIMDLKTKSLFRLVSEDLGELLQKSLTGIKSENFELSIYFGRNLSKKYDRLAHILFDSFRTPFIRAYFEHKYGKWTLKNIKPIAASEIPESHQEFVVEALKDFFTRKLPRPKKGPVARYDLAILVNPKEKFPPSDKPAIQKFVKAATKLGFGVDVIEPTDASRIPTYDALFIRETTAVNHHTYLMARRAEAEGLVVIDDPESILRCCNKVYLSEILEKNEVPAPKTRIVTEDNMENVLAEWELPCIMKIPDSSFSQGVEKLTSPEQFRSRIEENLKRSELLVLQEFMPTEFDWRVGFMNGEPLYVCKYFMAKSHWQIIKNNGDKKPTEGNSETIPVERAPRDLIKVASAAAGLIGKGLYGVDVKQIGDRFLVIEVNDNPSIESKGEDAIIGDLLYEKIMRVIFDRLEDR